MENKSRAWTKWVFWFSLAVAVVAVNKIVQNVDGIVIGVKHFLGVIGPFLMGILISYILYVPCRKIEEAYSKTKKLKIIKKKARPLSIITVYIIAILLIVILVNVILPPVIQSVTDLVNNFGHYYNVAITKINELPEDSILKSESAQKILIQIQNTDVTTIINTEKVTDYLQSIISMLGGVFDVFVAIIVSVYILNSRRGIIKYLEKITGAVFKENTNKNINKYFNRTNEFFFKFLASQLLDAFVVGVLTSIAMSIMGVKYAVLLGFMIGLFNIIPYFGAIVAVIIATLITLLTGGFAQALWMVIVVTILQQIDANIINPKIVGDSLKMSPLLVIFAVTIGGAYFGILGMFLAVPVAAVLKLLLDDIIEWKQRKEKATNE